MTLLSMHAMLAGIVQTPELCLTPKEAESLAEGIKTVAAFYPTTISPKTMAWINLSMIAGGIYGTRIVALYRKQKPQPRQVEREKVQPISTAPPVERQTAPPRANGSASPANPIQLFGWQNNTVEDIA